MFGWSIAEGRSKALAGLFFAVGSSFVAFGAIIFEVVVAQHIRNSGLQKSYEIEAEKKTVEIKN